MFKPNAYANVSASRTAESMKIILLIAVLDMVTPFYGLADGLNLSDIE